MRIKTALLVAVMMFAGLSVNAAELGRTKPEVVDNVLEKSRRVSENKATGFQFAFFTPAQLFPESYDVYGLRLNLLYGRNQNIRGFDFGGVNVGEGLVEGLQLGVVNKVNELAGVQIGCYNLIDVSADGCFQLGLFNQAVDFKGLQLGPINYARRANGVQFGIINMCETISGVQIGVINVISQSDFLVFSPIFNAQF